MGKWVVVGVVGLVSLWALGMCGCPVRRAACQRASDCVGSVCSRTGYCVRECTTDRDCPHDARCESRCGLCISTAGRGLATCFAAREGVDDPTNACRFPADAWIWPDDAFGLDVGPSEAPLVVTCDAGPAPDAGLQPDAGPEEVDASLDDSDTEADAALDPGMDGGA